MERYENKHLENINGERCQLDNSETPERHNQFTFFSANMEHFLPALPTDQHETLFRETIRQQRLSRTDLAYAIEGYLPKLVGWDSAFADGLNGRPAVIACAHMGAHMLIGLLLARAGVQLAVLVVRHLVPALTQLWQKAAAADPSLVLPHIIDANARTALRQLMTLARKGCSILVYWDGEEHTGPVARHQTVCVPLLGQHILLHRGIPFLAKATGLPVYPLNAYRQEDGSVGIQCGEGIKSADYRGADGYRYTMQAIVDHFSPLLLHFPAQWSNWTHLHRMICADSLFMDGSKEMSSQFGVLHSGDAFYLLKRRDFRVLEVDQRMVSALKVGS